MQAVWTRRDIERWLVLAFRVDARETSPGAREAATWPALYVLNWEDRRALQVWAVVEAGRADLNIAEQCRARGISRATFERRRARALDQIEAGLNGVVIRKCA